MSRQTYSYNHGPANGMFRDTTDDNSAIQSNYGHLFTHETDYRGVATIATENITASTHEEENGRPAAVAAEGGYFFNSERGAINNVLFFRDDVFAEGGTSLQSDKYVPLGCIEGDNSTQPGNSALNFVKAGQVNVVNVSNYNWLEGDSIYAILFPASELPRFEQHYHPSYLSQKHMFVPVLLMSSSSIGESDAFNFIVGRVQANSYHPDVHNPPNPPRSYGTVDSMGLQHSTHPAEINLSCPVSEVQEHRGHLNATAFQRREFYAHLFAAYEMYRAAAATRGISAPAVGLTYSSTGGVAIGTNTDIAFEQLLETPAIQEAEKNYFSALLQCKKATVFKVGRIVNNTEPRIMGSMQIIPNY